MPAPPRLWFGEGLRFRCSGCGDCCRGDGYVWVDADEVRQLADFLEIEVDDFGARHLRQIDGRLALVDHGGERSDRRECVFWDNGCTVYPARPRQCRSWPFWPENLASRRSWDGVAESCPGIGTGRLYRRDEILHISRRRGRTEDGPTEPCCGNDTSRPRSEDGS